MTDPTDKAYEVELVSPSHASVSVLATTEAATGPVIVRRGSAQRHDTNDALAIPEGLNLPRLITDAGEQASRRFINFFTAEIENDNTRAAYFRAIRQFDAWCAGRGIGLSQLEPFVVAVYARQLKETRHPQTVKQHLAALRMLFDNLVVGQVIAHNPAASVKGPRYSTKKGRRRC